MGIVILLCGGVFLCISILVDIRLLGAKAQTVEDDDSGKVEATKAPDKDKDGIPDALDACPITPETVNDYLDNDGCPDSKPELVTMPQQQMQQQVQQIHDKTEEVKAQKDRIDEENKRLLEELIRENPELAKKVLEKLEKMKEKK